jgi:tetratricopeptide (TPR) repeat protein
LYYMPLQIRRFLCFLTLTAAVAGGYWSVRLGRADWLAGEASVPATSRSFELAPGNSAYLRHAAEIRDAEGLPATGLRERAVLINPLDSDNWIHLAARAEMEGRVGESEQDLLRAFEVDRQFEPRWALANFYFRQGNPQRSLDWARKTLEFGGGDLTSVFQLCWTVSGNGGEILDKAIPHRAEVLGLYLLFLDGSGRVDEARDVASVLLPLASADQAAMLVAHCGRSLDTGKPEAAVALWNGLIGRGLIAGGRVEPGAGRPSADPGFEREMTGSGFEWSAPRVDGVAVERLGDRRGVRVVFSRNEPEHCAIVGQWIALAPGRTYRFHVEYAAGGMSGAGLKWVIYAPKSKAMLMSAGLVGASRAIEERFESPADEQLARLELRYDREPGTVRPEGSIEFSHLGLEFAR